MKKQILKLKIIFILLLTFSACSPNLSLSKMSAKPEEILSLEMSNITEREVSLQWQLRQPATAEITLQRDAFPDQVFTTSVISDADNFQITQLVPDTEYRILIRFILENNKNVSYTTNKFKTEMIPGSIEIKIQDIFDIDNFSFGTILPHRGDSAGFPTISKLKLYEDGEELLLAHSKHIDIANLGQGRFSHWDRELYFSSSNNSNPRTNKKKYHYVYQIPTIPEGPMGYVNDSEGGSITGGDGGETVTVSTLADLYGAVSDDIPRIVYVSGVLTGDGESFLAVGSNKTIIGLSGAEIRNQGLYVYGKENVILKNLKLYDGDSEYSPLAIKEFASRVWVDHCEFYPSANPDNGHTMASVTKSANYVTFSWNKFVGKYTGILIGAAPTDLGPFHVTIHHNLFENMLERQPTVRNGQVHVFNNYYKDAMTDGHMPVGITSITNSIIRTDANYFENFPGHAITTQYDPANETDGEISGLNTNFNDGSGLFNITTPSSSWLPSYDYSAYLHDVNDVPEVVMSGAGVKP